MTDKLEQIRSKINYSIGIFEGYTQHHKNKGDDVKAEANEGHANKLKEALKLLDEHREGMEWQPVFNWELFYEVSRCGSIRKAQTKELIGQWYNEQGYALARLSNPRKVVQVHRIVAQAFIQNLREKPCVNHIDNNPKNNDSKNLEWCTQKENLQHARNQNRMYTHPKGLPSKNRKLSDAAVKNIRLARKLGLSYQEIAVRHNTNKWTVGKIIRNESYNDYPQPPKGDR